MSTNTSIPDDLRKACELIVHTSNTSPNAKAYADALINGQVARDAEGYNISMREATQHQCLYILSNIQYWRHPAAADTRAVVKRYADAK